MLGTCFSIVKKDTDQIRSESEPHVIFGKAMLGFLGAQVEGNTIKFDLATMSNVIDRTKILKAAVLNLSQAVAATS